MTDVLTRLRELAEHATPGPWDCSTDGLVVQFPEHLAQPPVAVCDRFPDATFFVAMRDLWLPALDVIEAAEAAILTSACDKGGACLDQCQGGCVRLKALTALSVFEAAAEKETSA